ncbi:hypothetical protein FRC07_014207 [Ceratobasidium sp. 392]|nr:hypothetical protein FRC07_014207 [Ceratobasidium sp. 392]
MEDRRPDPRAQPPHYNGYHPQFTVGDTSTEDVPLAHERADWLKERLDELKAALEIANEKIKEFYDHAKDINTDRPSKKLSAKRVGPFEVIRKVGTHAFEVRLPPTMKIHPVFHISKLFLKKEDPFNQEPIPLPPEIAPGGEEEYEVDHILSSRRHRGAIQYYVSWKGYGPEENTWEPYEHLTNAQEELQVFHRQHPRALKDPRA